jgi:hypothetical protein
MERRRLPAEYAGWETHEAEMRRMTTPEMVAEIQDGPPDRRLAAMSVVDLAEVATETIRDWIRALPEAEANELAGAIPAQRPAASPSEDLRWVDIARFGYERRRLATFLVMLFCSLEAIEAKDAEIAAEAWEITGKWLTSAYDTVVADDDDDSTGDLMLFVFEVYLDRAPVLAALEELATRHPRLALQVSTNPSMLLIGLQPEEQRRVLSAAALGGGLPLEQSWKLLYEPGF